MFDSTKIKAVLWDLDDTLYSRVEAAKKTFPGMFRELLYPNRGEDFIQDAVRYMMTRLRPSSMMHEGAFRDLLANYPPDRPYDRPSCLDYYYTHICQFAVPYPEVIEVVEKLRTKGIKTAIVTNIPEDRVYAQKKKIEVLNLAPLFDEIIISGEVGIHKPNRAIFDYATEKLGVSNEDCIFVGDDADADVVGGLNAEMEVVWVDRWNKGDLFLNESRVHRVDSVLEYFNI